MIDSPEDLYGLSQPSQRPSPEFNTQGEHQYVQRGAITRIVPGSQISQYHNSASTTDSAPKTSDRSGRSSDKFSNNTQGTQGSNGVATDHAPFSQLADPRGGSQLPDTQEQVFSSQHSQSESSQQMPPPATTTRQSSINNLLNDPAAEAPRRPVTRVILDWDLVTKFHEELVSRSSGLSVEQLEQVNASMMDAIWRGRGNWNRNWVMREVKDAFNETVKDIEAMQTVLGPSQEDD
jgi:ATPase family AAA domain-containing protein 2